MKSADFFVVRSPLLPASHPLGKATIESAPEIREAIELASPSLAAALAGPGDARVSPIPALNRYLERARGRSTPFSLLAGYSVGDATRTAGSVSAVEFAPRGQYRRVVRLDIDVVTRMVRERALLDVRQGKWMARRDLVRLPDTVRSAVRDASGDAVAHTDVTRSKALSDALAAADEPIAFDALVAAIAGSRETAKVEAFVRSLIERDLIVPALLPPVLVEDELSNLEAAGLGEAAARARAVRDEPLGRSIATEMAALQPDIATASLIFDVIKPTASATLGADALTAFDDLLPVLPRIASRGTDERLSAFEQAFGERYENRAVPLLEALDPQRGLRFGFDSPRVPNAALADWRVGLFERACRSGAREVILGEADIPKPALWKYPEAFAVHFGLAKDPLAIIAPSIAPATLYFARAAGASLDIRDRARAFLAAVAAREPEVEFADISYFVPGRSAAFTQYPLLHAREIALSTAANPAYLDAADLLLVAGRDGIELRVRSTGKLVRVRPSGAANADRSDTTDLYRFLNALARREGGAAWSWGALSSATHHPRVRYGAHVLAPEQWRITEAENAGLKAAKTAAARWDAAQQLREARNLPRFLRALEGMDLALPVDLDDRASVEAWLDVAKGELRLSEAFPIDRSVVTGPEGTFHHEFVLPFFGPVGPKSEARRQFLPVDVTFDKRIPGDGALFLRFSGDSDELLPLLRELVEEVVRPRLASGELSHWFFLPYSDPEPHVRLRLFGDPEALWDGRIVSEVHALLSPLVEARTVREVSLETYDRESYRYGGAAAMDVAEQVFYRSSELALLSLEQHNFDVDEGAPGDAIVPLVATLRALLDASGLDIETRVAIARETAEGYLRGAADAGVPRDLAAKLFREKRTELLSAAASDSESVDAHVGPLREALAELHHAHERGHAARPLRSVMSDFLHVHAVRLLTTWSSCPQLETAAYHVLRKVLETELAQARRAEKG